MIIKMFMSYCAVSLALGLALMLVDLSTGLTHDALRNWIFGLVVPPMIIFFICGVAVILYRIWS